MLKIVSDNKDKEFSICFEYMSNDIEEINNENTCGIGGISSEQELTKTLEQFGAKTIYYDMFEGKETTKEEYDNHLIDYDGDKIFIVPVSRFTSYQDAKKCMEYLLRR